MLPLLMTCYRCPKSHITLAQQLVLEIEPWQGAPEGVIAEVTPAQLPQLVRKREDDLILGRKNAPLIELCIKLMREGIFARVNGREIGVRLTQVVQEVTRVHGYS